MQPWLTRLGRTEWFGLLALGVWIGWVLSVTVLRHASLRAAGSYVAVVLVGAAGVAAGRWLARQERNGATRILALVVLWVFLSTTFRGGAGGGPLGYSNANGALGLQLTAVSALLTLHAPPGERRAPTALMGVSAAAVLMTLSRAGTALLVLVLAASTLALLRGVRRRWWPRALGISAIAGSGSLAVWLATRPAWPELLDRALDPMRLTLWRDALGLWWTSPLVGSGPGSYREYSQHGADPDLARAHMSLLQVGSELGVVGVSICVLLVVAVIILASRGSPSAGLIGVTAGCALVLHSFIDHVLDFPAVWAAAGVMVGLASSEQLDVAHGECPGPGGRS